MDGPPFMEIFIGTHVEALFRWRGFSECVGYGGAVDEHVFTGSNSVEESGAGLVDAVSIGFVKDLVVARPGGSVTHAPSFLAAVGGLDGVRPDEVEDRIVGVRLEWASEHTLVIILV